MLLHKDKEKFVEAIQAASIYHGISASLVEKDYYVTLLLKMLNGKIPGLLFKGGTSLAKCYKIIDRFSEDIDLTLDNNHFSQSKKRNANKAVIEVCDELGFILSNREFVEKHSHGNYNVYNIEYPILFPSNDIKPFLKVEMVFIQKAYPHEMQQADSYIGSWLTGNGNTDLAAQFELLPFDVRVQVLERTLVDKVFAVCDYYLRNETERNSRHVYDISRILTKVELNERLRPLIDSVREDRKPNKTCVSAQDGANVPALLKEIIEKDFFKKDYNASTEKLLIKPVHYNDALKSLSAVIDSRLFDREYQIEIKKPSEIAEEEKAERRAKRMEGRGPETLVGLTDIGVFEEAKAHYAKGGVKTFENLYYGDQVFDGEEENERKLMEMLVPFCGGDRDRLIRVFKSSGQYRKDMPDGYYEKIAADCLPKAPQSDTKTPASNTKNPQMNSNHNSKS